MPPRRLTKRALFAHREPRCSHRARTREPEYRSAARLLPTRTGCPPARDALAAFGGQRRTARPPSHGLDQATVDDEVRAVDVGGAGRREHGHEGGDLAWRGEAAGGDAGAH